VRPGYQPRHRPTADVLAGGADGVHLYTFNQHSAVLAVLRKTGVIDSLKEDA
jgi:methylenetetrahydrofolate reductase (NADPH)